MGQLLNNSENNAKTGLSIIKIDIAIAILIIYYDIYKDRFIKI